MIKRSTIFNLSAAMPAVLFCFAGSASAQTAAPNAPVAAATVPSADVGVTEIVVTAQKRSERINSVPMSITAATGALLQARGVMAPADLVKVVPGFQYSEGFYNTPVFTIRGVGFSDNSAAARPTVSVYVDEIPLPFSALTEGVTLDLERVEVLKGPQGTLFGSNSTGGAINFIAAKPTKDFRYGGDFTIGKFGEGNISGFVSGPLSDTLAVRVAAEQEYGNGWQYSTSRTDKLGSIDKTLGRVIVDYHPTSRLRFELNVNGFRDKSDVQAAQYLGTVPLVPGGVLPPELINHPASPQNNRAADWVPGIPLHNNATFYQIALRTEYDLTGDIRLTSITAYDRYKNHKISDPDGVSIYNDVYPISSDIKTVTEELRLSGSIDHLKWIIGGNYQHDKIKETDDQNFSQSTAIGSFTGFGLGPFTGLGDYQNQQYTTKAAFANLDYEITPEITAHGGVRYTKDTGQSEGCTTDQGDGVYAAFGSILYTSLRSGYGLSPVTIAPGGCVTVHAISAASLADGTALEPGVAINRLSEHNVSWRGGLDYKPSSKFLVYANVSKGYKGGSFPLFGPSVDTETAPAKQESVLAYEAGFKATLFDRHVQLNGAVFHYDYSDKQFDGRIILTPNIFGAIQSVVNVPKSRVNGAELQLDVVPFRGLTLSEGATYLSTKVINYTNYNVFGVIQDFSDEQFPNSPKFQSVSDAEYDWHVSDKVNAFAGGSVNYQTKSNGLFGEIPLFDINSWATLDLRAGIEAPDKSWRLSVWGRNVTNTYYWTSANRVLDTAIRFTGSPATYGITLSFRGHGA